MKEVEIKLQGRVQGVLLRNTVKNIANNVNIQGFIINNEDGSVTILAQGKKNNLEEFLFKIHQNPGFSKIEELNCKWQTPNKIYNDFKIITNKSFVIDKAKSILNLKKYLLNKKQNIPKHIVIIPDGNRRWAKERGLEASFGHYKSGNYNNLELLFEEAKKQGVKYITIWGFSTENWRRNPQEIKAIFDLILKGVKRFEEKAEKNNIRFRHVGRTDRLPKQLIKEMKKLEEKTKNYSDLNIQLCLDYGGRDEIIRAIKKILKSKTKKIDENKFKKFLDTSDIPDPDLIIRTSGEKRISGIMPFQSIYSELYFTDTYFPDFNEKELRKAINEYSRRQRRFGN